MRTSLFVILLSVAIPHFGLEAATLGGRAAPGTPGDDYWQRFGDAIVQGSGGRLEVRLLIRGEVGPEEAIFAQVRRGRRIQIAGVSTSPMTSFLPELDVLRLPFVFDSLDQVGFVLDYYLKEPVAELLLEHDLIMLDWMSAGWLNLYGRAPIVRLEDIKGRRMRVNASQAALNFMKAVSADVVPVPFSDVVPGLQTGMIDGGEQSTQLFVTGGFAKFAPHFTRTKHAFLTAIIIANKQWYEGLSDEDRSIYRNSVPRDCWYRNKFRSANEKGIVEAIEHGLSVHEISDQERQRWSDATASVRLDFIRETGAGAEKLLDLIEQGKAAFAARGPQPCPVSQSN